MDQSRCNSKNTDKNAFTEVIEWIESIALSVFVIILFFTFCFRFVGVQGGSMLETLQDGDRLIIQKCFYTPKQGDIVVLSRSFLPPESPDADKPIIKRIIAVENQTVEINSITGDVFVDGVKLNEDYITDKTFVYDLYDIKPIFKITVPENELFVMGDNRGISHDSRNPALGTIDERYVLGKAVMRVFPFDSFGKVKGWEK